MMSISLKNSPDTHSLLACFQALSDPIRLQVIELLRSQELCVCDLCDKLDIKQPKLSFHLKILKQANLLISRQEGRWVYYRLNLSQLVQLEEYLADYRRGYQIIPSRSCNE